MGEVDGERRVVRLLGVPVQDFLSLLVHFDDAVRELQLMAIDDGRAAATAPLRDLAEQLQGMTVGVFHQLHVQASAARRRGLPQADLTLSLRTRAVELIDRLVRLAREVDDQSRRGRLLGTPVSANRLDLLAWIADELHGQLGEGRAPQPYPTPPLTASPPR